MRIFCIGRLFRISLEYAEIGSEVGLNRARHVLDILPRWATRVRTWLPCAGHAPTMAGLSCRVPLPSARDRENLSCPRRPLTRHSRCPARPPRLCQARPPRTAIAGSHTARLARATAPFPGPSRALPRVLHGRPVPCDPPAPAAAPRNAAHRHSARPRPPMCVAGRPSATSILADEAPWWASLR
jgi:hypothetical protein